MTLPIPISTPILRRRSLPLRQIAGRVLLVFFLSLTAPAIPSAHLLAAQTPAKTTRVVQGKVVDKAGAGLKGATVYLKDDHTLAVKSYIAADDGSYRFGQLTQNTDYEVWAESSGKKSAVKSISSFDSRKEFDFTLKIDK